MGIQFEPSGDLAESSIGNVAILTQEGVLRTPPFERILAGTTVKRLWELAVDSLLPQGRRVGSGMFPQDWTFEAVFLLCPHP